ncbi:MAG: MOSC domain-containing protein [Ignavibacteriae bacterium]|nr:MOSC domain-containing protein [Ignavibacteriota bacterium]
MSNSQAHVASVVSLWRYPVKSMMGEELNAAVVTQRGVIGDRAYALIDLSTGKVASAKNPQKWAKLFNFRAAFVEPPRQGAHIPPVRLTLPDGNIVTTEQSDLNQILSNVLEREVALGTTPPETPSLEEYWPDMDGLTHRETTTDESMPAGTFFDFAVVHLLTTATIDRLRELYPQGRFEVRRFRPNIVVESSTGEKGFLENSWVGRTLAIGTDVRLNIVGGCPRCVMTTLPQGDLPKDPGILRTAAQHNQVNVGVYASVLQGGTIHRGDPVRLE